MHRWYSVSSRGQLSVWVRTQRQVPLTGCCSGSARRWPPRRWPDGRTDGSPRRVLMDGRSHDWSSAKRRAWRQVPLTEFYLGWRLDVVRDEPKSRPVFPHVEYQWMGAPMIRPRLMTWTFDFMLMTLWHWRYFAEDSSCFRGLSIREFSKNIHPLMNLYY